MSHVAKVKTEFKDRAILKQVCERLGLKFTQGLHQVKLYSDSVTCEFSVQLPGWRYPIAIKDEEVAFDNYNGSWGHLSELEKLQDQYSRDVVMQQAMNIGMFCEEEVDEEGAITLTLTDYS